MLYVGIDIGKRSHVAGFLSAALLAHHGRFESCPTLVFEQSRDGLDRLLSRMRELAPLSSVRVVLEYTGHYHQPLEAALREYDIPVYVIAVKARRINGLDKTDKRDALRLANTLYGQLSLGLQEPDPARRVESRRPPSVVAQQLRGLLRRHYELTQTRTQLRNKLTALCDALFPEFATLFHDPNLPTALELRRLFPTPAAITAATREELRKVRRNPSFPSEATLSRLQQLAATSIGVKDASTQAALVLEQQQLIESLCLADKHLATLDAEIERIVLSSREGQILTSLPPVGPMAAGAILSAIGTIENFESAAKLKKFFGWAPQVTQTGTSFDQSALTRTGRRLMKQAMFLVALTAVRTEPWKTLYARLVPRKCIYDARTKTYKGKMRVIGRICGQLIGTIYALLRTDVELLAKVAPGESPPPPRLYDPGRHKEAIAGHSRKQETEGLDKHL